MSAETVISKQLLKDHMLANGLKPHTIEISKPMIKALLKDHMLANRLKPHTIEISKPMIKAFRNAHAVYKAKLEEERKNAVLSEHEKQAAHISNDIEKVKQQFNQMNKSIETIDRNFVDYMILAERNDLALVRKGNELKRKCSKTKDARSVIEKQIVDLKEKKRKFVAERTHFFYC